MKYVGSVFLYVPPFIMHRRSCATVPVAVALEGRSRDWSRPALKIWSRPRGQLTNSPHDNFCLHIPYHNYPMQCWCKGWFGPIHLIGRVICFDAGITQLRMDCKRGIKFIYVSRSFVYNNLIGLWRSTCKLVFPSKALKLAFISTCYEIWQCNFLSGFDTFTRENDLSKKTARPATKEQV